MVGIDVTDRILYYAKCLDDVNRNLIINPSLGTLTLRGYNMTSMTLFSIAVAPDLDDLDCSFIDRDAPCQFLRVVPKSGVWNLANLVVLNGEMRFSDEETLVFEDDQVVLFNYLLNFYENPLSHKICSLSVVGAPHRLKVNHYPINELRFYLPPGFDTNQYEKW